MAAEAFIHLRVTQETKSQLRALAQRENQSESALLKQLLGVMLRGVGDEAPADRGPDESANREARLTIRLQAGDHLLLRERAGARSMPAATYVSVLVRAHLRSLSPLPKGELLALKGSIAELASIGRNINQIAKVANDGGGLPGTVREEFRAMLRICEALRDNTKALLKANVTSWRIGHAEANL
ncbi:MAG: plasmid mobilization relaxosome protein MobC [Pseudomonadota bacterium]